MEERVCWVASDGRQFMEKENCEAHEQTLAIGQEAEKYRGVLEKTGLPPRSVSMRVGIVEDFLQWKATGRSACRPAATITWPSR